MGIGNAAARVGGMVTPFLAQELVGHGHPGITIVVFAASMFAVVGLTSTLPLDTKGMDLCDTAEELEEYVEGLR